MSDDQELPYWGFCDRLVNNQVDKDGYTYRGALEKNTNEYAGCWQNWNGAVINKKKSNYKKNEHCDDQQMCNFWVGNSEYDGDSWWNDDNFKNYKSDSNWGDGNTNNCELKKKECGMKNVTIRQEDKKFANDEWANWSCNFYKYQYISPSLNTAGQTKEEKKAIDTEIEKTIKDCKRAGGFDQYGKRQQCHDGVCGGEYPVLNDPLQFCSGSECQTYKELVDSLLAEGVPEKDLEKEIRANQYDVKICCQGRKARELSIDEVRRTSERLAGPAYTNIGSVYQAGGVYNDLSSGSKNVHIIGPGFGGNIGRGSRRQGRRGSRRQGRRGSRGSRRQGRRGSRGSRRQGRRGSRGSRRM